MSVISSRHSVNLFKSGESKALSGQRLSKIGYNKMKKNGKEIQKFPSICVSVPQIKLTQEDFNSYSSSFSQIIKEKIEDLQDSIIRSLYESSGGTLTSVADEEISLSSCIAFMESQKKSKESLSKEELSSWFKENVEDNLTVVFCEKLGFTELSQEAEEKIQKYLKSYQDLFCEFSASLSKISLSPQQIQQVRKVLEISSVEDEISRNLEKILFELENKNKKIEEFLL